MKLGDTSKLGRRTFLGGMAAATARRGAAARKPNFLFLLADDHAAYVMGCDGNRLASTPNLDGLASEGTRFARHYCNSPVCTPSRQSFFTGQLPHMAGVTRLPTPLALDKPTLAKQFQAAGYATAVFGKMHLNRAAAPGFPAGHGHSRPPMVAGQMPAHGWSPALDAAGRARGDAQVAELTGLLRESAGGDRLDGWPNGYADPGAAGEDRGRRPAVAV